MIIPIISYICLFMFPFFMYHTLKKLSDIRDLLKEQNKLLSRTLETEKTEN